MTRFLKPLTMVLTLNMIFAFIIMSIVPTETRASSPRASSLTLQDGNIISGTLSSTFNEDGSALVINETDLGLRQPVLGWIILRPSEDVNENWSTGGSKAWCTSTAHYACVNDTTGFDYNASYITTTNAPQPSMDEFKLDDVAVFNDTAYSVENLRIDFNARKNDTSLGPEFYHNFFISIVLSNGSSCGDFQPNAPGTISFGNYSIGPIPYCGYKADVPDPCNPLGPPSDCKPLPWNVTLINDLRLRLRWLSPYTNNVTVSTINVVASFRPHWFRLQAFIVFGLPKDNIPTLMQWTCTEDQGDLDNYNLLVRQANDGLYHDRSSDICSNTLPQGSISLTSNDITSGAVYIKLIDNGTHGFPTPPEWQEGRVLIDYLVVIASEPNQGDPFPWLPSGDGLGWILFACLIVGALLIAAWKIKQVRDEQ